MKIAVLSFTRKGADVAAAVQTTLRNRGHQVRAYGKKVEKQPSVSPLTESLPEWTAREFEASDGLVFVGATGIAVRAIAPYLKSKTTDPAVVVVDERGRFSIPILSGHIGGANDLATQIAEDISALCVVTTATDINGKFAVDQWARESNCAISDMIIAKEISAAVLDGEKISFFSSFPIKGMLPGELVDSCSAPGAQWGVAVDIARRGNWQGIAKRTLQLIPKVITLGIGCRRGTSCEKLEALIEDVLERENIRWEAVSQIATIDLKKDEEGLISLAQEHGLHFQTYTSEQLRQVEGEFTPSAFVSSVTGVDNVCERAAVYDGGTLWKKKEARDGMTIAFACSFFSCNFGDFELAKGKAGGVNRMEK